MGKAEAQGKRLSPAPTYQSSLDFSLRQPDFVHTEHIWCTCFMNAQPNGDLCFLLRRDQCPQDQHSLPLTLAIAFAR